MSETPLLSEADVRLEVERLFRRGHRSKLVALFGRGPPGRFELDGSSWQIIPTSCELDLREKLPSPGDHPSDASASVYLVDWAEDALPLDVACRLAGGRLYHVARDARLAALFGARDVDRELAATPLARLALSGRITGLRKITGLRLTLDELWTRVLEAQFNIPESALESGAAWIRWVRESDAGPSFARACETDDILRGVRRDLVHWIEQRLGAAGSLGFRAWELGIVDRALQALLLLTSAQQADNDYVRGLVNGQLASLVPGLANEVRGVEAQAPALLARVLRIADAGDRRLIEETEQNAVALGGAALTTVSEWLPAGHAAREAAAAAAITAFVATPTAESLDALFGALEYLSAHQLDSAIRGSDHLESRRMAGRLAAWLLQRRVSPQLSEHGTAWQPAIELARRYAEEGGFLDWARRSLRSIRGAGEPLLEASRRLNEAVDVEARKDDERFAKAYVAWVDSGKPSAEVLPIEHVTKRVVAQFLGGGTQRRLLVVLMDGMSYATAVQLLQRLREQRRWGPIAWRPSGWNGLLALQPVLAAAPTLTNVSRAAFFAGSADPRFGDQSTDKDGDRWISNSHIRHLLGDEPLKVFTRRDILAGHELIEEVKQAIADEERRVVAVIVNAIDEDLKGSLQVAVDYSRNAILPLEALLNAAEGAERAVLLVADHGHVAGDSMRVAPGRVPAGREHGARWRALAEGEGPQAGEVLLPKTAWKPRGAAGVAALWDTSIANRAPQYGEHGGLSLAEAVAPAFLIGPEWLDRVAGDDADLSCRVLPEPDWWRLKIARPSPVVAAPVRSAPAKMQLPLIPANPAPQAAKAPTESTLVARVRESKLFAQQVEGLPKPDVERVLVWLKALEEAGGNASAADFARLCGIRPHQVGGVVARMGVLNVDGFTIVEHDVAGRRVVLHKARLLSQFGVTE